MILYISTEEYSKRSGIPKDEVQRMFHRGVLEGKQESKHSKIYIKVDDAPPSKADPELMAMVRALCKQFNTPIEDVQNQLGGSR